MDGINIYSTILLTILLTFGSKNHVDCKKILVITPSPSFSHQIVFRGLCLELNRRGHEVVIVTSNPIKNPNLTNYKEIDINYAYQILLDTNLPAHLKKYRTMPRQLVVGTIHKLINNLTEETINHPEVRKLYAPGSNEKFDAVIVEGLLGPGLYAMAHKLNAPLIGMLTVDLHIYHHYELGNPVMISHISQWENYGHTGNNLPFWIRLWNFVDGGMYLYRYYHDVVVPQDKLIRRYFGKDLPHVTEFGKNMSIMLVNHDTASSHARPVQPNIIYFNSLHVSKTPPVLPKEMKNFLDGAINGFVYMSLGSNVKSAEQSPGAIQAIVNVFSRLPYRVLWKFETDQLSNIPDNILISKWIPQQGVLAHPNIKLFIYQGGLQSTEEAIHYGVPVIGIPVIFDQEYRIGKLESLGIAKRLDHQTLNEKIFSDTIHTVLNDASYKKKMKELSSLIRDKPVENIENTIWWIEHVMRRKGAPHLRFDGLEVPWYKRYDMDIIAFLSVILFIMVSLFSFLVVQSILWILKRVYAVSLFPTKDFNYLSAKESKKSK